jgi:hypothetical protein
LKGLKFWLLLGWAMWLSASAASAQAAVWADSSEFCDHPPALSATQNDQLLSFAAQVRAQLAAHPGPIALVSRSGLNLDLLGQRYSHSGWALHPDQETPVWEVRQLYYACQDQRPRLFDQGLSAFIKGTHDPELGFVSLVWLPADASATLAQRVAHKPTALALLGAQYSANAYPFSERYQNCNQWALEMLAPAENRGQAQAWLQAQQYEPSQIQLHFTPILWLSQLSPWLHGDDHPNSDWEHTRFSLSLPESLEAFVHQQWPTAQRVELCHRADRMVVHPGWSPLSADCQAGPGDTLIHLNGMP